MAEERLSGARGDTSIVSPRSSRFKPRREEKGFAEGTEIAGQSVSLEGLSGLAARVLRERQHTESETYRSLDGGIAEIEAELKEEKQLKQFLDLKEPLEKEREYPSLAAATAELEKLRRPAYEGRTLQMKKEKNARHPKRSMLLRLPSSSLVQVGGKQEHFLRFLGL